jgi:glycosyltransferase involved in cell wall biosynthesis
MKRPTVSFVIPCYKLGHLLPECINSILAQSFEDFEILIMDDCSPDNTPSAAGAFRDERVKYVRNEPNLGHLKNYNKGIQLSAGKYIWLISADDYLRRPYILERYVRVMEQNPDVGYACCAGVWVRNGEEREIIDYSVYDNRDRIVSGPKFLESLVHRNIVLAASGMVRRDCYDRVGAFPLDAVWAGTPVEMGWAGDWYLWCMFALHFNVAFFAEPMVCYREHDLNMTAIITDKEKAHRCAAAELAIPWMVKEQATALGYQELSKECLIALANEYSRQARAKMYRSGEMRLDLDEFDESLQNSTKDEAERRWLYARFFLGLGDRYWYQDERSKAAEYYFKALSRDPSLLKIYAKLMLLPLGRLGSLVRETIQYIRNHRLGTSNKYERHHSINRNQ